MVEKYRNDIFRTVFSILKNQKDAEDAAQEVFLKIYTSLPSYENQGFKTWITRIAVNHSIDLKRKSGRRPEEIVEVIDQAEQREQTNSVERKVFQLENKKRVKERLMEVPENYREVIYGYYFADKTYQQLAEEQKVQVKTIETKLYRARIWMKKHWKEDDFL